MIVIRNKDTGAELGELTEQQLAFLTDQLEEENAGDQDYYLNQDTLDYLEEGGAEPALLEILRQALGQAEDVEIVWERQ